MKRGKVFLIGAGPGDPELLTIKAAKALAAAEVILIDDLANPAVLEHARRDARVIAVGKRGGCRSTPQAFIERLMLRYARQGRIVARVKGGDPFVFGRGGEELERLRAAGIEAEVICGITAGIAAAACAGIALTHRDRAHGVTLLTGHPREGVQQDWRALVAGGTTLVIYMGMHRLEQISASLLAAGMRPCMPAAIIQQGTLPEQRSLTSTLSELATQARAHGLQSPAIIIIGEVVAFADAQATAHRFAA
jgi:uroporphyrin-III C-methyltransferase